MSATALISILEDVTELIQYGYTAKSSAATDGPRYLRITDIQDDRVQWSTVPRVSIGAGDYDRYRLAVGDIVFARSGATVGKSFLVRDDPGDAVFASYLIRLRCCPGQLDPEYAELFFRSDAYWQQIRAGASGTGQPNFNGTKLGRLRVPLPSIKEQRAIVAKLQRLRRLSSAARRELEPVQRLVERFKESVLAAALRGELTTEWRRLKPRESGAEVLAKVKATLGESRSVARATTARNTRQRTSESGLATWEWARLDAVAEVMLGRQRSPENHHGPHMRPYLRAANITWEGWDLTDVNEMNFDERDFERFRLLPDDVLVNEGSGSAKEVGKPALWKGQIADCCFQNTLILVRPTLPMSEYIYYVLLHAALSGAFIDDTRGVNINHIGQQGLAKCVIPVPPLNEQREIVRFIKAAFEQIVHVENEVGKAARLLQRLEQASLAEVFRLEEPIVIESELEPRQRQPRRRQRGAVVKSRSAQSHRM